MKSDEQFLADVLHEVGNARTKFPQPNACLAALTEEVGELANAMLDRGWPCVYREAVQVAAMALRCAIEGDPTLHETRLKRISKNATIGPRCHYHGCPDPYKAVPPCALCYE